MTRSTPIGVVAVLLVLSLPGCTLTGWIAEKLGVDDAVASRQMETEFESYWTEREERRRANILEPAIRPLALEDLEAKFYDLSIRAQERADAPNADARFKARFYHLAARAAIGAADHKKREDETGNLVEKGKALCTGPLKEDFRARSSICLTMGLLEPVAITDKIGRLNAEQMVQPLAQRNWAEIQTWPGLLEAQFQAFESQDAQEAENNPSLSNYRAQSQKSVACTLRDIRNLYDANDARRREILEKFRKLELKFHTLDCFKFMRERAGLAS